MEKIHLQGIGKVNAIPAKELKVGDTTLWNYGGQEKVVEVTPNKSGKTLVVKLEYIDSWSKELKTCERRFSVNRLVGILN